MSQPSLKLWREKLQVDADKTDENRAIGRPFESTGMGGVQNRDLSADYTDYADYGTGLASCSKQRTFAGSNRLVTRPAVSSSEPHLCNLRIIPFEMLLFPLYNPFVRPMFSSRLFSSGLFFICVNLR